MFVSLSKTRCFGCSHISLGFAGLKFLPPSRSIPQILDTMQPCLRRRPVPTSARNSRVVCAYIIFEEKRHEAGYCWNRLVTPVCRWESLAPIVPYDSIIHYYKPNWTYTCLCSCVPTPSFTQTIATNASTFGLVRSYPQKVIFSFKIVWLLYADCSIRYTTSSTPHERIAIEDVPGLWFAWRGGALIKWNIRFWKLIFYYCIEV